MQAYAGEQCSAVKTRKGRLGYSIEIIFEWGILMVRKVFFFFLIGRSHINHLTNTTQVYLIVMHRFAMHSSMLGR